MSTETESRRSGLPHAVFLQRVTDEPATSPEVRLGQGAFLTLRFVDLLTPDREPPTPEVFRYQWAATERYCAELSGEGTEASILPESYGRRAKRTGRATCACSPRRCWPTRSTSKRRRRISTKPRTCC